MTEVFIVYDTSRKGSGGWGFHRVATFRALENAERFIEGCPELTISRERPTVRDMGLCRD